MEIVGDEITGLHLFEQGKLDIVGKIPDAEFPRMKATGHLHTDPFVAVYYLSFNLKKPPFERSDIRRVISAAIRKPELVAVLQTGELAATSWIPKGIEGYSQDFPGPQTGLHEVTSAKSGLAHVSSVVMSFDSSARNRIVAEKIQQDLLDSLGLKISLENMDWKSYIRQLQTDAAPIFRFAWLAPLGDPIVHLRVFQSGNPNNYSNYSNPSYDALVERISKTQPGPERDKLLHQAQEILVDQDAVVVPLYDYVQNHLVASRVRDFAVNPFGVIRFSDLSLVSGNKNQS
jgi:oligopeptide transport system substrate-binding protein